MVILCRCVNASVAATANWPCKCRAILRLPDWIGAKTSVSTPGGEELEPNFVLKPMSSKIHHNPSFHRVILWAITLLLGSGFPNIGVARGQTSNPFLSGQVPPLTTPSAQLPAASYPTQPYAPGAPAINGGSYQPGVNFSVPQVPPTLPNSSLPAGTGQGLAAPPVYAPSPSLSDPFANATVNFGNVPPGYPNMPAPSSGWYSSGNTSNLSGRSLFGAQTPTYGPMTGYQNPGLLNNPQAYGNQTYNSQSWQRFWQQSDWQKLFHAFRMRHTFVDGGGPAEVEINDTEIATSLSFPNWLHSSMPLTISPGFASHLWQGPHSGTGADLPSSAYSAYLQLDHSTPLNQQFGGEISFTTGIYSAYDTITSHSLRFTGTGLGWIRLSPNLTFKLGVEYLDRIDIKMLPAGGIFWTPDANSRFNLYFPRPKASRRLPNLGNTEIWGYVSAEYGGGSWTVRREANFADQVDINDYRVMIGLEWIGLRGITGFGEVGAAFDRELIYRSSEPLDYDLGDAIFARGGFAF